VKKGQDLVNRGNNLFLCGFIAVVGLGGIPELPAEGGLRGAIDEGVLILLAIAAVAWYLRNRYRSSWLILGFPIGLLVMKAVALLLEDPDDRGDDIGILIMGAIFIAVWSVIRWRTRDVEAGEAMPAAQVASGS
jgi:hypothetical protein